MDITQFNDFVPLNNSPLKCGNLERKWWISEGKLWWHLWRKLDLLIPSAFLSGKFEENCIGDCTKFLYKKRNFQICNLHENGIISFTDIRKISSYEENRKYHHWGKTFSRWIDEKFMKKKKEMLSQTPCSAFFLSWIYVMRFSWKICAPLPKKEAKLIHFRFVQKILLWYLLLLAR